MNSREYYLRAATLAEPTEARLLLDPESPGPPLHNLDAPIFMQPLLPPQPAQFPRPIAPAPPVPSGAPVNVDFFTQPPAFHGQLSAAHLHQLQDHDHPPYSSGDDDDGYTLEFPSLDAFHRWRAELEDRETVEFIKGDTHRSKAIPPRFNEHTKLICARHCKTVRNKYIKKCPERSRNIPSRKIEGEGCHASISYKTYYGTATVRAMYFNQHSHPIGRENLPFTRRGRKLAERERKLQQQIGFSRANPVLNSSALAAVQEAGASETTEVRSSYAVQKEPPPMASLEPPITSPEEFAAAAQSLQKRHQQTLSFIQAPSESLLQMTPSSPSAQQVSESPLVSFPSALYRQTYANDLPLSPETASAASPSYEGNDGHISAYRVPPPPPSHNQFTQVHQPQPTNVMSQAEIHDYQTQHLPTPTTPSSQIQHFSPSHSYPHPRFHSQSTSRDDTQTQSVQAFDVSNLSPLARVARHTQTLPGPSFNSQSHIPLYPPQEEFSFNQDRWNRLETLFQAVRLRARSYLLPEPTISTLESLLLQLYMEGSQGYPRSQNGLVFDDQTPCRQQLPS